MGGYSEYVKLLSVVDAGFDPGRSGHGVSPSETRESPVDDDGLPLGRSRSRTTACPRRVPR